MSANWPIVLVHGPRRNTANAAMRTASLVGRMTEKGRFEPVVNPQNGRVSPAQTAAIGRHALRTRQRAAIRFAGFAVLR